jgi:hypothetical protein
MLMAIPPAVMAVERILRLRLKADAGFVGWDAAAPSNTQQIKESLDLVKQQWLFFENALNQKAGPDKRPQIAVATTSERILEEMETVVGLYEKLK